jgi:hypothetical protein
MAKKNILLFLAFAAISGIFFTMYALTQQVYRMSANDPQIKIARDAAEILSKGKVPPMLLTDEKADLEKTLSPFLIVYDSGGKPVLGTALLSGQIPSLPAGIFEYTAKAGEDRVSWQPNPQTRIALVVVKYDNGFAASGRSLLETEIRESQALLPVGLAYFSALLLLILSAFVLNTKKLK